MYMKLECITYIMDLTSFSANQRRLWLWRIPWREMQELTSARFPTNLTEYRQTAWYQWKVRFLNLYSSPINVYFLLNHPTIHLRWIFCAGAPVLDYDNSLKSRQEVREGTSLILMVNIRGNPIPDVTWSRADGSIISASKHVTVEGDATFSR